ncbi:MAG TPA: hypothetical protein VE988_29800 [Gemmataceae bacterium]|nr:hypothetical protein [Gemmataceae bacterium]
MSGLFPVSALAGLELGLTFLLQQVHAVAGAPRSDTTDPRILFLSLA